MFQFSRTNHIPSLFHQAMIVSFCSLNAIGQESDSTKKSDPRKISVTQSFDPAFRIEPLSHQLVGRSGSVTNFEFTLESANREAEVEVMPIGLRQEISGMILHDVQAPLAEIVKLISPQRIKLEPNKPAKIEGFVQFPKGEAKYHSVGILVRDVGALAKLAANNDPNRKKTQAAIQFVTQYVLRLDLEMDGQRGENPAVLELEKLNLLSHDGRPKLIAQILNPSDSTFEYEVRAKLRSSPSDRNARSIRLVMPVREEVENEDRYTGRILPKSRVRMVELLPEAIASGIYDADIEILIADKTITKKTQQITVDAADFPAQEVLIAQLGKEIQVSPAQIELSQLRGGNRRATLVLKNNGKDLKNISITGLGTNGLELGAATIQPNRFALPPGGNRKVTITLKSQTDIEEATLYGTVDLQAESDRQDFDVSKKLPLALMLKKSALPEIKLSSIQWDSISKYPGFRCNVTNLGNSHLPLNARLSISSEAGNRLQIPGGFGKWLMPGTSSNLEFRLDQSLPPGKYQMRCELQHGDKPIAIDQVFEVSDLDTAEGGRPVNASK
jgi:hypothetical protein